METSENGQLINRVLSEEPILPVWTNERIKERVALASAKMPPHRRGWLIEKSDALEMMQAMRDEYEAHRAEIAMLREERDVFRNKFRGNKHVLDYTQRINTDLIHERDADKVRIAELEAKIRNMSPSGE